MKISVITPSYNQAAFIERTIRSVLDQDPGVELELIVVDGGSGDGTLQILENYGDRIRFVSEKDRGQADAVNKGIAMATGDVIGWLNSDDLYLPGCLARVAEYFKNNSDCRWLYGKCRIIDENDREILKAVTFYKNINLRKFSLRSLLAENYISQPAVFFRKSLFDEAGPLDLGLHYTMDYDLWLRFAGISPACVLNEYLSAFRRHGTSKSETGFKEQFREEYKVAERYGPDRFIRIVHQFNIQKIITSYRLIGFLNPLLRGFRRW